MATGNSAEREDLKDGDKELVRQRWRKQVHGRREGVGGGREEKKKKITAVWEKEGSRGKPGCRRGATGP